MIHVLESWGINRRRLVSLELFDYLVHFDFDFYDGNPEDPIVIAGTLRRGKAGYAYQLPLNMKFNLYGVGYEEKADSNVRYFGAFEPEELVTAMRGSFGLVWDGVSGSTCSGAAGEYLKINNPHKTSLYLAAGLPVIVWRKAAVAEFIERNRCGIPVDRISDISEVLNNISTEEYCGMRERARTISEKLVNGKYAERAIDTALERVEAQARSE